MEKTIKHTETGETRTLPCEFMKEMRDGALFCINHIVSAGKRYYIYPCLSGFGAGYGDNDKFFDADEELERVPATAQEWNDEVEKTLISIATIRV